MENSLIKRAEYETAKTIAENADKQLHSTQVEVNKERITASERVGWFSAGSISLSFTLIGYLFNNTDAKFVLSGSITNNIPLISVLIMGWVCLIISIIASLLTRILNATYLNYNQASNWSLKNRELKEKMLEAIEAGVEIIFSDANSREEGVRNIESSKDNLKDLESAFERRKKIWIKASNLAQAANYVGVITGFLFLSIFLIIITYRLI